ncbi:MAG: GlsB/YeaQ/YmgE family stress response membrane protein, partial [Rubrivivax sp.]|nr:GlsB/YeaQ/YmgE family stress response membrane protein [Rubrivivax sp.]
MNFIIWLMVGGLSGWLATVLMKTNDQQGMLLNVVVGIVGAFLGGWLISPLVGIGTINQSNFSLPA